MRIADMRHAVAVIDYPPRHSGGGCTLCKQTPRPAAVASEMGHERPRALQKNSVDFRSRSSANYVTNTELRYDSFLTLQRA
jgi:hypothetical protein